ncbi:MAG: nucleoside monophosphate kinase [Chlamydiae bacterium]|nr:nucleoside monophosphate kinase [Chlamydiota bacterium]
MKKIVCLFLAWAACAVAFEPVVIVLGPPGSGKGNFSQFFKENSHYTHLSAGDLLRKEIADKTPLGLEIEEVVKRGERVQPKIMQGLMEQHITALQDNVPLIIDGFGVQKPDIPFLHDLLSKLGLLDRAFVLFFDASDGVCKQRISGRFVCGQCDKIYNSATQPPKVEGCCDICSGALLQRSTDTPEVIEKRMVLYRQEIEPNYKQAMSYFPFVVYHTDVALEHCMEFYRTLAKQLASFKGSAKEFVETAFPRIHSAVYPQTAFVYDRYTAARGAPALLEISCRRCQQVVMHYQKDGPGPLLRCYFDRIQGGVRSLDYTEENIAKAPKLICFQCNTVLGEPYIYQKHGEYRPAYLMLNDLLDGNPLLRVLYVEKAL